MVLIGNKKVDGCHTPALKMKLIENFFFSSLILPGTFFSLKSNPHLKFITLL
jgi:hypothetical protein